MTVEEILKQFGGKVYSREGEIVGIVTEAGNIFTIADIDGNKIPVSEVNIPVTDLGKKEKK